MPIAQAAPAPAGYSGTPLAKKLGLKDGQRVLWIDLPETLADLRAARSFIECADAGWDALESLAPGFDVVHAFTASRGHLESHARTLMSAIAPDGMIWISWPKKASKVPTDVTEDVIRDVVLPFGLVDVKVCAVDGVWSGLKLVIRSHLRPLESREGRK